MDGKGKDAKTVKRRGRRGGRGVTHIIPSHGKKRRGGWGGARATYVIGGYEGRVKGGRETGEEESSNGMKNGGQRRKEMGGN